MDFTICLLFQPLSLAANHIHDLNCSQVIAEGWQLHFTGYRRRTDDEDLERSLRDGLNLSSYPPYAPRDPPYAPRDPPYAPRDHYHRGHRYYIFNLMFLENWFRCPNVIPLKENIYSYLLLSMLFGFGYLKEHFMEYLSQLGLTKFTSGHLIIDGWCRRHKLMFINMFNSLYNWSVKIA